MFLEYTSRRFESRGCPCQRRGRESGDDPRFWMQPCGASTAWASPGRPSTTSGRSRGRASAASTTSSPRRTRSWPTSTAVRCRPTGTASSTPSDRRRKRNRASAAAVDFHVQWIDGHRALARITLHWDESELSAAGRVSLAEEARRFSVELDVWRREATASGAVRSMSHEVYAALFLGPLLEYGRRMVITATTLPLDRGPRGAGRGDLVRAGCVACRLGPVAGAARRGRRGRLLGPG